MKPRHLSINADVLFKPFPELANPGRKDSSREQPCYLIMPPINIMAGMNTLEQTDFPHVLEHARMDHFSWFDQNFLRREAVRSETASPQRARNVMTKACSPAGSTASGASASATESAMW